VSLAPDLPAQKAAARQAAYAVRKLAFAAGQGEACDHLGAVLAGDSGVLAGYMPMRTEIDPLPAMAGYRGRVCVPVIVGKGVPLAFREWTAAGEMVAGEFGARVPAAGDWLEPSVLIVPLLAWDRRGYRLGYGGGYYDRTLERLRGRGPVLAVGFGFGAQEVAGVPVEATDQRLDLMVTEAGVVRFGSDGF
jgi:5-formyltetrahydrofolate cyclo-ligase